jgi:hypothetical protein
MELRQFAGRAICGTVAVIVVGGCAFNPAKPPLPRHGAIESAATPRRIDELSEIVARAEIFYLPSDRIRSGPGAGAGPRMLEALHGSGTAVALGWGVIDADQQPLLDEWNLRPDAGDDMLRGLSFSSTERRDNFGALLRISHEIAVPSIALHCAAPSAQEDRCTADHIVRHFRQQGGGKLLVIMERRDIEAPQGVPYFVAQELGVRQLVLDSKAPPADRVPMLTAAGLSGATAGLEIVDRAPGTGGNWR